MGSFYTDVEFMLHAVNTSMYIPVSVLSHAIHELSSRRNTENNPIVA